MRIVGCARNPRRKRENWIKNLRSHFGMSENGRWETDKGEYDGSVQGGECVSFGFGDGDTCRLDRMSDDG